MKRFATDEEWRATAVDLSIRHHDRTFTDASMDDVLADAEKIADYIVNGALPPSITDARRIDVQSVIAELEDEGE